MDCMMASVCGTEQYREMVEWIAKDLEVTTLRYQTLDDMIDAIGLPRERLCLYCWTGRYLKERRKAERVEEASFQEEELVAQE